MRTVLCDRCGKDIGDVIVRYSLVAMTCIDTLTGERAAYDLCGDCKKALLKWIKGDK